MLEVHLVVDAPVSWIREMDRVHSALVKITDIRRASSQSLPVQEFVEISSTKVSANELIKSLGNSTDIQSVDLVPVSPHRIIGAITTERCPVCSTLSGLNCSLLSANTRNDGRMDWKILITGEDTLKELTGRLDSKGVTYEIADIDKLVEKEDLTTRQEQIAKIALELGFFEFPKKIRLVELSKRMGISPGTLSEILRRAEKHILAKYFREH
ncbi:MAG TPA: helix-turn-helix domain-containing protein [Nitrososphaerales archaeon]|nr:helix-turn-helix domain-containing protein [Nitrososphaerales archaeon]